MPTLIVETGQIVAGANSYVSLADANAYHALVGNTSWTVPAEDATADEITALNDRLTSALVMAARSLNMLYGARLAGKLVKPTQDMLYPRTPFYDTMGRMVGPLSVPVCLKEAQCEIALMRLTGINILPVENSGAIQSTKTSVGKITEERTYYTPVRNEDFPNFGNVSRMLSPILVPRAGNWSLRA